MRRGSPELLLAALIALLLGSILWYTHHVVGDLRLEAARSSRIYARIYHALGDTTEGAGTQALLGLSRSIVEQGVPVIVTDTAGNPTAAANLPFEATDVMRDGRVRAYVRRLDGENPPVVDPMLGQIHFGNTPLVEGLRVIPVLQVATAAILLFIGFYVIRVRGNVARERIWAGMARESAHQLGTPLSSLAGWIELLEEQIEEPSTAAAAGHMRADLERLDRVAHRFERIGRDPKCEPVDVTILIDRVASYFRARVPTLANTIAIDVAHDGGEAIISGDSVLLEWAIEVLAKNAIDALAGRGGRIRLSTARLQDGSVRIRVADDGPGIPASLRARVFEPGFSTKKSGWGIGLSLARRIVEENHRGKLVLAASEAGATFDVILR
ncbi:MAG TPA: HAMP domain-containing sensor histidine kinase [Gemmatimonadaceae bacterium]|jgi:signal transduction histidine kinase|nr:HAMP domain-containing sensor histidine kinase [Gemmatimonadaceae bacterium]